MRKISLPVLLFSALLSSAQVSDSFSDGDFTRNPAWTGTTGNFIVNNALQLQSAADTASRSFLFTPSTAFDDAVWECRVMIDYPTSQFNYAAFYLTADRPTIDRGRACYVRVGGATDAVSLFARQDGEDEELIRGTDGRLEGEAVEVTVRVTRDREGLLTLFSRLPHEADFVTEGTAHAPTLRPGHYVGVMYANSGKTGHCYRFDDLSVSGTPAADTEAPEWISAETEDGGRLRLTFSEAMDFDRAAFEVDNGVGQPVGQSVSADGCSVELLFPVTFEPGVIYRVEADGLTDRAGLPPAVTSHTFGVAEPAVPGDVLLNELMFDRPEGSHEYIEVVNVSGKWLDASQLAFVTRKTDGSLNTPRSPDRPCPVEPGGYVAVTENAATVRAYHQAPAESRIHTMKWTDLNNEEGTLLLMDREAMTVYDELTYSATWHHPLIRHPKGVALERISPDFITQSPDTWHSASSETHYGTPGYRNSQHRDAAANGDGDGFAWPEPEAFSPDNDGVDDLCFIRYRTDAPGYAANVAIFDAVGVEVCRLASGDLLSTEGSYTWDGTLSDGTAANVGVYVIYFEIYNTATGVRRAVKKPVVVSAR